MKTCRLCGQAKPLSDFYPQSARCKRCKIAAVQAREREDPAAHRERRRAWYATHRERVRAVQRAYAEQHREAARQRARAWFVANPDRVSRHRAARRARMRAADVGERISVWEIYERDGGRCHICGELVPRVTGPMDGASLDHLIPLSQDGRHVRWNVRLAHRRCNNRRYNGVIPAQLLLPLDE